MTRQQAIAWLETAAPEMTLTWQQCRQLARMLREAPQREQVEALQTYYEHLDGCSPSRFDVGDYVLRADVLALYQQP